MDRSFKETLEQIEENRRKEWVGIPFEMGPMDNVVPYIEKKRYILLFGASGVGKSRFGKKKFLIDPYNFSKSTGYKIKIIWFSLEEPKHDIMTQIISYFYYKKYGERHAKEFFSRDKPSDEVMQRVMGLEEEFLHFSEIVDIVDNISNPTGLMKYVESYFDATGKKVQLSTYKHEYRSNAGEHVLIGTDTLNALHEESGQNKFQTIFNYSLKYCKKRFVDYYGATAINFQQQDKSTEQAEFTMKGGKIEYKTLPNRSGLAECKQTFNDADLVFSLYSPHLYGIARYPFDGDKFYNINMWQDNFRVLNAQKNRHGISAVETAMHFDGAVCDMGPLPPAQNFMLDPTLIRNFIA